MVHSPRMMRLPLPLDMPLPRDPLDFSHPLRHAGDIAAPSVGAGDHLSRPSCSRDSESGGVYTD